MPRKRKPKTLPTLAEVAKHFSISETTVFLGKRTHADFPLKHADGYHVREFETFAERHQIWHRTEATNGNGMTLTRARVNQLVESTALLRVANKKAQLQLDTLSKKLCWLSDVEDFHGKLGGVILRELKTLDNIEAELPKKAPSAKQWQSLRGRVVQFNLKVGQAVAESARKFISSYKPRDAK